MNIDIMVDYAAPMKGLEKPQGAQEQKKVAEDDEVSGVNW
jgi:hypothetical protein